MLNRKDLLLYAVTDRRWLDDRTFLSQVEEALKGGATMIQLREKEMEYGDFFKEAVQIKSLCKKYGVPLIINDNVELALDIDADGVHLGKSDMPIVDARKILGHDKIIGATAKTVSQALDAWKQGADYLGSGAVFGTGTKKDAKPMEISTFKEICGCVDIPVVAIGGITADNIDRLRDTGLAGVAVVSGIFAMPDVKRAARALKDRLQKMT